MELEEEEPLELEMEGEFTLDDVLAQDASDLDMNAIASAADDELSSIYATAKSARLSIVPLAHLEQSTEEDEVSFKLDAKSLQSITGVEEEDEVELSTRGWNSILGGSGRRDSLSLPSFTRRDSFSLLSNRHLRTSSPELEVPEESKPASTSATSSRRQSLAMESTRSDFGKILGSAEQAPEIDPEETITLNTKSIRSRRTSLAMDVTRTDLGEIIQQETQHDAPRSARKSTRISSRRASLMDMTITDVSQILMREEEPMALMEDDAATQTIRMDLTRTDLGALLDSEEPQKIDLRRTISFKNRRQSLAMDETVSNFGSILDGSSTTANLKDALHASVEASVIEGEETVNMSRALETAEERAAKPVSALLSKLGPTQSPARNSRSKSRRQSLAMEMTSSNLGQIINDAEPVGRTPRRKPRQSLAMDHTISNFGEILADIPSTDVSQEIVIETPKAKKTAKSRRQSLAMDMTISGIGGILEEEEQEVASSAPNAEEEEHIMTPVITQPAKTRRQSLAMDMTMSNMGEILKEEEATIAVAAAIAEEIETPKIAHSAKSRRQSLAMDMTISDIGGLLEDEATSTITQDAIATPKIATPKSARTPRGRSRRQSLATADNTREAMVGDATPGRKMPNLATPESAKKRPLPTRTGIIPGFGLMTAPISEQFPSQSQPSPSKASTLAPATEEIVMELETPEVTANFEVDVEMSQELDLEPAAEIEMVQDDEVPQEESAMEITAELPTTMSTAEDVPLEDQDTIELPVAPGTVVIDASTTLEEADATESASRVAEAMPELATIETTPSEEPSAAPAVADLALLPQSSPSNNDDDVLFSDVVSITSSFPNLSMSITSRNAIRRAMEAAGASDPTTEELSVAEQEMQQDAAAADAEAAEDDDAQNTMQSIKSIESVESPELMQPRRSSRRQSVASSRRTSIASSRRQSTSSRRQSTASRRNSTRLSFLDTIDEPEDIGMDTAQLDALLSESTQKLAKRDLAPSVAKSNASIFSALAVDNDILRSADEGSRMDVDTAKYPLLAALSRAVPHKVSAQPFDADAAHEIALIMAKSMGESQAIAEAKRALLEETSSQMDVTSTSSLSHSQSLLLSQHAAGIVELDDNEDEMNMSGFESVTSVASFSPIADDENAQLEAAQKLFEARIEAQMRTPGARRRSLLHQGVMTPGASPRRIAGRSSFASSTGRISFGGVASPAPSHATATMTLSGLDSLTTVANGNSLSRFLSTFGVNFLDSIASRRQSLGIRVAEPRSEYDRMITVMRTQPELDLTTHIFSSLTMFAAECEAHILEMEETCRDQCAAKEGVYQLFAQCITARNGEARKDLAALKQLALSEAKCHLNERFLGFHYESQLHQTLQITHTSAKAYLAELEDRQAATFRTKASLAKQAEDEASVSARHLATTSSASNIAPAKKSHSESSAATKAKSSVEQKLAKANETENLSRAMLGWQLRQLTPTSQVYDFRNAVELSIELSGEDSSPKTMKEMKLASVMRVRTADDDVEHQLVESLLSAIPLQKYCGSSVLASSAVSEVSTMVGRILDLVTEIRTLRRSWFVESVECIHSLGAAIDIRFSDPISGNRFVTKLAIEPTYPFVAHLPVEVDLAFSRTSAAQITDLVDEEVAKNTYKLLSRICKRLDRLCKA